MTIGVLLAAGRGRRLSPLTDSVPKSLLPLGEGTFLSSAISAMKYAKIDRLVIVVNYLSDQIISYVDQYKGDLDIRFVFQRELNGSGAAMFCGVRYALANTPMEDQFLVSATDYEISPDTYLRFMISVRPEADVGLFGNTVPSELASKSSAVKLDGNGFVEEITEKPTLLEANTTKTAKCVYLFKRSSFSLKTLQNDKTSNDIPSIITSQIREGLKVDYVDMPSLRDADFIFQEHYSEHIRSHCD